MIGGGGVPILPNRLAGIVFCYTSVPELGHDCEATWQLLHSGSPKIHPGVRATHRSTMHDHMQFAHPHMTRARHTTATEPRLLEHTN